MDSLSTILLIILIIAFIFIYLMNVRIRQLYKELDELKNRITITDEELTRLSRDIDEFKKIKI